MSVLDDDLVSVFETITEAMFEARVRRAEWPSRPLRGRGFTASIVFRGGFAGVLKVTFSDRLARALTASMLQEPAMGLSVADMCDALGELVNIGAGNLKGVLPPCELSLPSVQVRELVEPPDATELLGSASLSLFGEPLWVELVGTLRASEPT